jgi:signal peptidase I
MIIEPKVKMMANKSAAASKAKECARRLKEVRQEGEEVLKEARRLRRRYGKRVEAARLTQIDAAIAQYASALKGDDPDAIETARRRCEEQVDRHWTAQRRSPQVAYVLGIAKALAVALLLRLFLVEAFRIPSGSMIPTFMIGDQIFVNKLSYGVRFPVVSWMPLHWGGYQRGEIIVFVTPQHDNRPLLERQDLIKRIVGLPGDTIEVINEVVHVNGQPQPRTLAQRDFPYFDRLGDEGPWVATTTELWQETLARAGSPPLVHPVLRDPTRPHASLEGPFKVPAGHLFMMGDNRDNSADSRFGGWFVPFDHVKGRALVIWLSWGKPGVWLWGETGFRFDRMFTSVH